jgi:type II secretory pathway component PulL
VIDLPFSDKDRIREILPFELDGMILGGSENVVFDDIVIGTSDNEHQVLAVYVEKTVVRKILEKLKPFGVDPVFITSIELKNMLKDFAVSRLYSPVVLEDKDRSALAIDEIRAPTMNLRRDEFSYTRDIERTRKYLNVTAILLISIALVLAGDVLFKIISLRSDVASLRNEMRKEYQAVFPGEKNMNELYQFKSHEGLQGREDAFIGVDALSLLLKLSQVDRQGTVINEVTMDRDNLAIRGEAPSLSDIQQLQDRLKNMFDAVNISDSRASAQGRMMFTITAKERRA